MTIIDAALLGGRPPRVYLNPRPIVLASQVDITGTSLADVTGLSVPLAAGVTYAIETLLRVRTSATNCGWMFDFNGPAFSYYASHWQIPTTQVAAPAFRTYAAYDAGGGGATSGLGVINTDALAIGRCLIRPSAAGSLIVRARRGTNAGTISIMPGSQILAIPQE